MIKAYCFDTEKDWDEGIYLRLESQYKSLWVLVCMVQGTLTLLKEKICIVRTTF